MSMALLRKNTGCLHFIFNCARLLIKPLDDQMFEQLLSKHPGYKFKYFKRKKSIPEFLYRVCPGNSNCARKYLSEAWDISGACGGSSMLKLLYQDVLVEAACNRLGHLYAHVSLPVYQINLRHFL